MAKRVMFFAVLEDIEPIINKIETDFEIRYYQAGLLDAENVPEYNSALETPGIGVSSGDWMSDPSYLILLRTETLRVREVPQKKGEIKYAVDQQENKDSVRIKFGGIYRNEPEVLVAGVMDSISNGNFAKELLAGFKKNMKKEFKLIDMFYVGKEAEKNLAKGWRLVLDQGRSKEFDLKL